MIIQKMHTMAKPIASAAGIREMLQNRGTCGIKKTAAFAKEIIDKYTKRLNHPFDPVSLIFLEQMADGSRFARSDGAAVLVTCRLLSYLIQNTEQAGLFSDRHSFLAQQLTGQVERNLEMLKDSAADAGWELDRCYLEYQKIIRMDRDARMEQVSGLQEQIHRIEQVQMQKYLPEAAQGRYTELSEPKAEQDKKPLKNRMPFVMTHAFFANLNHWIRENRLADYHQIWEQANERQMVQQKLKYYMQRFLQEEDFIRQEEQLSDIIWQYGRNAVMEYLDQADLKVYEKLLPVLHTLSGMPEAAYTGNNSRDDRAAENKSTAQTDRKGNREAYRNTEGSGLKYRDAGSRYPKAAAEQVLEEYQAAAAQLERLLAESDEQTKVFLQETAAEYKKYFMEYVRAVSGIQKLSAAKETAGRKDSQRMQGMSMAAADMQIPAEEDQEVFSDAEIELLLQKKESQAVSAELKAAELKLKLLAYREIAEQFQREGSSVLHRETLQKITELLDQDSFLHSRQLTEYQKADAELSQIVSGSDDVTQNMLLEKAEEYQELFYRYIRADQEKQEIFYRYIRADQEKQETVSVPESFQRKQETASMLESFQRKQETVSVLESFQRKQETVSAFGNSPRRQEAAADGIYQTEYPSVSDGEALRMRILQSGEYETLFSDRELAFLLQSDETGRMSDSAAAEQKTAAYKLDLLAYRETAQQVLRESAEKQADGELHQGEPQQKQNKYDAGFQKETFQKIVQLFDQVSGVMPQQENTQTLSGSSSRMHEEEESGQKGFTEQLFQNEIIQDRSDIRSILEHGSLPERKLLFFTAEKHVDELLIQLQEAGDDIQENRTAHAARQQRPDQRQPEGEKTEYIRYLVQLKNQLQHIGGQSYHGTGDWGFLLTKEAGGELLRIIQQEEHPVQEVWKQKVQQSLTDFYHHIKEEELRTQVPESSSFLAEWNPVFRQEEWQQLRSLVQNQPADQENQLEQIRPENAFQHRRSEQQSLERRSFRESAGREAEHVFMGQGVDQELKYVLMEREEKLRQAMPASGYLHNVSVSNSIKLLQKDIWKKASDHVKPLVQDQDFMQPPAQDAQSRLPMKAADAHTAQDMEAPAAQHIAGGQDMEAPAARHIASGQAAMVHTQQHTKDTAQLRRIAEEKERQQKQELQRLEGDLLDYRSELQAKTVQLGQIEKKMAAQDKELKQVRESRHTVRKQGKTVAERRQMFHQLKEELQLERMRSGLI